MKSYRVNEIFYSLQGEGARAGTPNVFVRFSGCNQQCRRATHGFDCDTKHDEQVTMSRADIVDKCWRLSGQGCRWIVFTGGEPLLQLDSELCDDLRDRGFRLAVETNGSILLALPMDWVTVSPKMPEKDIRQRRADEVKYVRANGQPIPLTHVEAEHYLISPAFQNGEVDEATLAWCIQLTKEHPPWRLSIQLHKWLKMK